MVSKKEVKYIQSLSYKKNRDEEGVFVAEGPKLVNELLAFEMKAKLLYATTGFAIKTNALCEIKTVDEDELQRVSQFEKANEVVGIFYKKTLPAFEVKNKISLALDGIQDPGNLGTIIRTAHWFGVIQIFASPDTVDCYNNKVVQSTMGSLARVAVYHINLSSFLKDVQVPVLGALLNGNSLYKTKTISEGIIVIGNEGAGIRESVLPLITQAITIPRIGDAESLNAGVATGILLSHLIGSIV